MSEIDVRPYKVLDEDLIIRKVAQLRPVKYNKFQWWRRFTSPRKPLEDKASLLDKIKNGDLEFSNYFWQASFCEVELNAKRVSARDVTEWIHTTELDRVRRNRLWADFEKDEKRKLEYIRKQFVKKFKMSSSEYEQQLLKVDGTLEDLYYLCERYFGLRSSK
jgi:hypothetical protein